MDNLYLGAEIEYERWIGKRSQFQDIRRGIIAAIDENTITIQHNQYREYISFSCLKSGRVVLLGEIGGRLMQQIENREILTIQALGMLDAGRSMASIAKKLEVNYGTLDYWIKQARKKQEPSESTNSQVEQVPVQQEVEAVKEVARQVISQMNIVDQMVDLTVQKSAQRVKDLIKDEFAMMLFRNMVKQGAIQI